MDWLGFVVTIGLINYFGLFYWYLSLRQRFVDFSQRKFMFWTNIQWLPIFLLRLELPNPLPAIFGIAIWDEIILCLTIYSLLLLLTLFLAGLYKKVPLIKGTHEFIQREMRKTLDATSEELNNGLAQIEKQLSNLRLSSDSNSSRILALSKQIDSVENRVTSLEKNVDQKPRFLDSQGLMVQPEGIQDDIFEGRVFENEGQVLLRRAKDGLNKGFKFNPSLLPERIFYEVAPVEEEFLRTVWELETDGSTLPEERTISNLAGLLGMARGDATNLTTLLMQRGLLEAQRLSRTNKGKRPGPIPLIYQTTALSQRLFVFERTSWRDGSEECFAILKLGRRSTWAQRDMLIPLKANPSLPRQPDAYKVKRLDSYAYNWANLTPVEILSSEKILDNPKGVLVDMCKNFQDGYERTELWYSETLHDQMKRHWERLPSWLAGRVTLQVFKIQEDDSAASPRETIEEWYCKVLEKQESRNNVE